jgi:hypothetical protein
MSSHVDKSSIHTIDVAHGDIPCLMRALTGHIMATTRMLRSPQAAHFSPRMIAEMHADIRCAATLAGQLPSRPIRTEEP